MKEPRYWNEIAWALGTRRGRDLGGLIGTATPLCGPYLATAAHVLDDIDDCCERYPGLAPILATTDDDARIGWGEFDVIARWDDIDCALIEYPGFKFAANQRARVLPNAAPPGAGIQVQAIGFPGIDFAALDYRILRGHIVSAQRSTTPGSPNYELSFRAQPGVSGAALTTTAKTNRGDEEIEVMLGLILGERLQATSKKDGEEVSPPVAAYAKAVGMGQLLAKSIDGRSVRALLVDELGMACLPEGATIS